MAHTRQSRPDSGLGFRMKVLKTLYSQVKVKIFKAVPSSLESGAGGGCRDLRTSTSQNGEAVPRRARIEGSRSCVSLKSRLKSNKEDAVG